jgi:putative zinc finger/helix-turn-helix YgiT family protein
LEEVEMKCDICGAQMKSGRENYRYTACGLDSVTLMNVEVRRCPECGEYEVEIPRFDELHRLIAQTVASKKERLTPQEIRFLRKYLGFSGVDFAATLDVTPETVSRWENGKKQMSPVAERALRLMVFVREPIAEYPLEKLAEIAQGEAVPLRMKFRESRAHWKAETVAA